MNRGVYVLVISVQDDIRIRVGALGSTEFQKGLYIYVGSAQSNLEKRIARHLRSNKRRFWHVDYLLSCESVKVVSTVSAPSAKFGECRIAGLLSEKGVPIKGFGCSGCDCDSHLFCVENYGFLEDMMTQIR